MNFPTDGMSLGQMRRLNSSFMRTADLLDDREACEIEPFATHYFELRFAERAFAARLGLPDPYPSLSRAELILALREGYRDLGISSGAHESDLLIKGIEAAAVAQAEQIPGASKRR